MKPRIAFLGINKFNPFLADGVSRATVELLGSLRTQGYDVAILSFHTNDKRLNCFRLTESHIAEDQTATHSRSSSSVLRGIPYHQTVLPFKEAALGSPDSPEVRQARRAMMSTLRERQTDLVLTCDHSPLALTTAWLAGLRGVHFFHSPAYVRRWAADAMQLQVLSSRTLLAASDYLRQTVRDSLQLESRVLYPLWDLEAHRGTGEPQRTNVVGYYSGGWHKGDPVVERLVKLMPDTTFVVVGRCFTRLSGDQVANLRYLEDIEDMSEFYRQISVLIAPSIRPEGFSRMILEAAVNGIPVIANRTGGIPEAAGDSGLLIDFDPDSEPDFDGLADRYVKAINLLLSLEEIYREYSERALQRAAEYVQGQDRSTLETIEWAFAR